MIQRYPLGSNKRVISIVEEGLYGHRRDRSVLDIICVKDVRKTYFGWRFLSRVLMNPVETFGIVFDFDFQIVLFARFSERNY